MAHLNLDLLSKPVFEQVSPPKMRATISKEELIESVRELLDEEINAAFRDEDIESMLKFGLGQGATENMQMVVGGAKHIAAAHRAKLADVPYGADPREPAFKRRANADANAANLGRTEPFEG